MAVDAFFTHAGRRTAGDGLTALEECWVEMMRAGPNTRGTGGTGQGIEHRLEIFAKISSN